MRCSKKFSETFEIRLENITRNRRQKSGWFYSLHLQQLANIFLSHVAKSSMYLTLASSMRQRRKLNKRDFNIELFPLPSAPQSTARTNSNEFIEFQNPWIFTIFFTFLKIPFLKKVEAITVKLWDQSPEKFLSVIWNLDVGTSKIRNITFIFQNSEKIIQKRKKTMRKFIWILKNY